MILCRSSFGLVFGRLDEVVEELLPNNLSPWLNFNNLKGEVLECPLLTCFLVGLWFSFRLVQSIRSQCYLRREKQLVETPAACTEEKCQLIDKLSAPQKEHEGAESSLESARQEKESLNCPHLPKITGRQ